MVSMTEPSPWTFLDLKGIFSPEVFFFVTGSSISSNLVPSSKKHTLHSTPHRRSFWNAGLSSSQSYRLLVYGVPHSRISADPDPAYLREVGLSE